MGGPERTLRTRMDFAPGELASSLKEEVEALCRRFEPTYWLEHDRSAEYPWEFVRAFAERGWLGLVIPEAFGWAGLGVNEAGGMLEPPLPTPPAPPGPHPLPLPPPP